MALSIFDLDETLIAGDSASLFSRYMVDIGLADASFLQREQELMQAYAAQTLSMPDYVTFLLSPLRALSDDEVEALMPTFVERSILPRIYPQALTLLDSLRREQRRVVLISATPEFIVRSAARALGIDDVLAIELSRDAQNRYDGGIKGIPTFRDGKVLRLTHWLNETGESLQGASFHSDSINDLPLLEQVDHPFATNPDPQLEQVARERDWPVLRWSHVGESASRSEIQPFPKTGL